MNARASFMASILVLLSLNQQLVAASRIMMASVKTIKRMASTNRIPSSLIVHKRIASCFATPLKYPSIQSTQAHHSIRPQHNDHFILSSSYSTSRSMATSTSSWEPITNHKTSKTVKLFKSVHRANKSKRSELGLTVAEGVRLVTDVLANKESRHLVRRIIISESLLGDVENTDQYQQKLQHWLHVVEEESKQIKSEYSDDATSTPPTCSINVGTDQVVAACSATVTSQGVVALMDIPQPYDPLSATATNKNDFDAKKPPFYLILDGLSDPGNVGTLLRTCAASHVTALILLPGSCDVWNPKAVRSAMGASFRVPVLEMSKASEKEALGQVLDLLVSCGIDNSRVFAATMESSGDRESLAHYGIDYSSKGGAAVILGREGEGLRSDVRDAIEQGKISTVHVPMAPGTESLNAAVCGSVIMFERMRQLLTADN